LGTVAFSDLTTVLVKSDIPDPVQAVFDCPVAAGQIQYARRTSSVGVKTGNPIDGFGVLFATDQLGDVALDTKTLCDMRKREIIVEFCAGPNMAQLQTAMCFIDSGVLRGEKR
jgi:hypothetical protein